MTKLTLFLSTILFAAAAQPVDAQDSTVVDQTAVLLLDRMSSVIGELTSCSFNLQTSVDKVVPDLGTVKELFSHQVHFSGPDKMHVHTRGPVHHEAYWYHTDILMYYSSTYNHYGFIETPGTIIETIDMVNEVYGIDFPAADFFYPSFTDDLLEHSDVIRYRGLVHVGVMDCHHIVAVGPEQSVQVWLSNDTFTLPQRFVVLNKSGDDSFQYEGTFSDWHINPSLPEAIFDFVVPETAKRLSLVPKNNAKK